ncbi:MAG: histidine kinase [Eubacteriales bacterium]|nr:histidine kinase [Eubacteriales bacterium]
MSRRAKRQKQTKTRKRLSVRWQILITTLVLAALATEVFFLALGSSNRLVSSVSDVWQEILETRGQQVRDVLLMNNPYLTPDTLYLAKLESVFYGISVADLLSETAAKDSLETDIATRILAVTNICTNIKKGISYNASLRSCYWMLADPSAPYVLINGSAVLKSELNDVAWINTCQAMDRDILMQWRTLPLSYLNTTRAFSIYRRIESESFLPGETITGYWVLNYDLSSVLNALVANASSSEKAFLFDTRLGQSLSVGTISLGQDEESQLMDIAKQVGENQSMTGSLDAGHSKNLYYRAEAICEGMVVTICVQNAQLNQALDNTVAFVTIVLIISCFTIAGININSLIRYQKYYNGLRKMFSALQSTDASQRDDARETTGGDYLLERILNNEVDLEELQGLIESKKELKSELDALYGHVQINSHFMLNTLDSIYWFSVANTGAYSQESVIIEDFCQILKFALDSSDLYTSLAEELECSRKFVELQQLRKNISFRVVWDTPETLNSARVGKLILQPIIENCIQHGFPRTRAEDYYIRISSELTQDGFLVLRVEDNGSGISDREIWQLNMSMKKQRYLRSRHIGMANVNRRLQVQFGEGSGVSLHAVPGGGLCVCLKMTYGVYTPESEID